MWGDMLVGTIRGIYIRNLFYEVFKRGSRLRQGGNRILRL